MSRRYNRAQARFEQPDPYAGSYSLSDPQSFNRYAYVQNDPVNFADPTGLMCFNIIRTDVWSDTGQVIGSWVVGQVGDCGGRRGGYYNERPGGGQGPPGPWVDPEGFEEEFGPPPPSPWHCGVNPITGLPGFKPEPIGETGHLRNPGNGYGHFGARRRNSQTGQRYPHRGVDIAAPIGTPVYANQGGTVSVFNSKRAGLSVRISYGDGYTGTYMHLSSANIEKDQVVNMGDLIGMSGNSGNAEGTPPHLHFEVRRNGTPLDPVTYLNSPCPEGTQ